MQPHPQFCHLFLVPFALRSEEMAVAEENVRRAIKNGDLAGLSAERLEELSVELEKPLGTDEYTCLHWACHYGKAEVIQMEPAS